MKGKDVVLGLLNQRELTGYEIKEIFEERLAYFFDGTFGMIYPTLKSLEKDQLITKRVVQQEGRPNKNIYAITVRGRQEFETYLNSDVAPEILKSDLLMRLYFSELLTDEQIKQMLQAGIAEKKRQIMELKTKKVEWQANGATTLQQMTVNYGISTYQAGMEVLEQTLKQVDDK